MDINLEWDANALAAPQSFRNGVQAAAAILDAAIFDPITVNIEVGYGEYDLGGSQYTQLSSNESLGGTTTGVALSYTELRLALASSETSATDAEAVNALPNTTSLNGQSNFDISTAEAKALGIISPTAAAIDGYTGFPTSFTGNVLISAAIVEEAHALGLLYGDLGLFAYTSPGNHYFGSTGTSAYFSLDGGNTDLASYDVGFDSTLFSNMPNDPLDVPDQGVITLTPLDLAEIDAIGFDVTSTPNPASPSVTTTNTAPGTAPTVSVQNVSVAENHLIAAASLITSSSVATGDSIDRYYFYVQGNGTGHFVFDGTVEPANKSFSVLTTELKDLSYVGGTPGSQTIYVGALDYTTNAASKFTPLTATTTQAVAADDFNGDGKSDLVMQNTNGSMVIYTMNGLSIAGGVGLGGPGPTWHIVATADFNGDGQQDLLIQNDNGDIVDYLMNGTTITNGYNLGDAGPSWHVRGTADFDGDGKADILLQNDDGSMVVWNTNGQSVINGANVGTLPAGWAVEAVADFNGDGHPDILVQNSDGTLVEYTMNGSTITGGTNLGNPGAGWSVAGTGDYNADGKADILLHSDAGQDVVWEMNGTTVSNKVTVGYTDPAYTNTVAGLDLDGDGHPDLVIENTTDSQLAAYTMNSSATITNGAVLGYPGVGWNVVGSNPITFIDGTGSNLTLTGTPGQDQFNLTSFIDGVHTITAFDPAQDTLALSSSAFPTYATVQANEQAYQGGTFISLTPAAAIVIQGVTPTQLGSANFVLR